jgi:DNA processing protein
VVDPAWVALSMVERVGSVRLRALVRAFGSAHHALYASADQLRRVPGIGEKTAVAIRRLDLAAVERAIERWGQQGIRLITLNDVDYPSKLAAISDAPPTLFIRGHWDSAVINGECVAIVGTREPSKAGARAAQDIAAHYAAMGCVVVSGLARGIDALAHRDVLAAARMPTLAVLGGGVSPAVIYPPEHRALAEDIARGGGALLSEQPPDAESKATYLVARNIISGLCSRVIIIETAIDGGAMHAARRAIEQGRTLCTLDLPASGNQALIAAGAELLSF